MKEEELMYTMSLALAEGIGPALAKTLIGQCGSSAAVFREKKAILCKIHGVGSATADAIVRFSQFKVAEQEMKLCSDKGIRMLAYSDEAYPSRLRNCEDGPLLLFCKGPADLNGKHMVSVVGTRKSTPYGKLFTDDFIKALSDTGTTVVSGLASGTDTNAHRASLSNGLPTVAVLGHGFGTVFPASNRRLFDEIIQNGAIVTEYGFKTPAYKENFPKRNRIVAGISDAVLVVESGIKGGSLITADLACGYNRDVYALPGKFYDLWSGGCNRLIHKNQAGLIYSIPELLAQLGFFQSGRSARTLPQELFNRLSDEEAVLVKLLSEKDLSIDALYGESGMEMNRLSFLLINLEFRNILRVLPGKVYTLQ